jgi:hypothetical protein
MLTRTRSVRDTTLVAGHGEGDVMAYINDLDEVRALIQPSIDGSNGEVGTLEHAFHPSAWMFSQLGSRRLDVPITEFFAMVRATPGMVGPVADRARHRHRVDSPANSTW